MKNSCFSVTSSLNLHHQLPKNSGISSNSQLPNCVSMANDNPKGYFRSIFCYFYIYFGTCSFGKGCRFIHPDPGDDQFDWAAMMESWFSYHTRKIPCKFFRFGVCKYGDSCRFGHYEPIYVPNPWFHFNALGFPKRWGEPDCSFYMRTGSCSYGLACKFHHPEPVFYYPYQENVSYDDDDETVFNELNQAYGSYVDDEEEEEEATAANVAYQNGYFGINDGWNYVTLNNVGLPLRPGKKGCRFYLNFGRCKFGYRCKFDHPHKRHSNEEGSSTNT